MDYIFNPTFCSPHNRPQQKSCNMEKLQEKKKHNPKPSGLKSCIRCFWLWWNSLFSKFFLSTLQNIVITVDVYEAFSSFPLKDSGVIKTKFTHVYYIAFNLHSYFVHYAPEAVKILK